VLGNPDGMTRTTAGATKQALGRYGEQLAERHLVAQGMVLLDRNWRCDAGEIDLVLRDGDVLVVCEVKTRSSTDYGTPHEAVTDVKVGRLRRLAMRWVAEREVAVRDIRIDLVGIVRPRRGASSIEHVRGIG
jgi:putative endonuclease